MFAQETLQSTAELSLWDVNEHKQHAGKKFT